MWKAYDIAKPTTHNPQSRQNANNPNGGRYFADNKRGELVELKQSLKEFNNEKDLQKRREILKRVIAFMTVGMDVSNLFSEMVMISNTPDLVEKKMAYLYLTSHAESNPTLSMLLVNSLLKEIHTHFDPHIRGLSLRSLCQLNLADATDPLQKAINFGLNDTHSYVRKTAVVSLLKLIKSNPTIFKDEFYLHTLYHLLRNDPDPHVVSNCIYVLNEINEEKNGWDVDKETLYLLLSRIRKYEEWGQCNVLELLCKYKPTSEEEMYTIMNILDDLLKHSSSAVIMGCVQCFIKLTHSDNNLYPKVIERLKSPLLTLMTTSQPETAYLILTHISLIIEKGGKEIAKIFVSEYKTFFCKYNDFPYIKLIKIQLLTQVTSQDNSAEVCAELTEYVPDGDPNTSKSALNALGRIALQISSVVESIVKYLLDFINVNIEYITSNSLIVLKDLLRKYRQIGPAVLSSIDNCWRIIQNPQGISSIIWILGEFGELNEFSPYILEMLMGQQNNDESIQLELITASVKLFFKRPGEMHPILVKVFKEALNSTSNPDIRDRALLYHRLISKNIEETKRSFESYSQNKFEVFFEDRKDINKLFDEFNTLSIVYNEPYKFDIHTRNELNKEKTNKENTHTHTHTHTPIYTHTASTTHSPPPNDDISSSLIISDLFDTFPTNSSTTAATHTHMDLLHIPSNTPLTFGLQTPEVLNSNEFQTMWSNLEIENHTHFQLKNSPQFDEFENILEENKLIIMASGQIKIEDDSIMYKLFGYTQDLNKNYYLVNVLLKPSIQILEITVKTQEGGKVNKFVKNFEDIMKYYIEI